MSFSKKNSFKKSPSSTSLATPIYHRRRRDWRDDQYLIEEIVKSLSESKEAKKNKASLVKEFKRLTTEIESEGYQSNEKASVLCMWIREQLAKLASTQASYDLRVHTIKIPPGISGIIDERNQVLSKLDANDENLPTLEKLFPDPEIRGFVLERVQLLHKGNLLSYLNSLVTREKASLQGESATISDLIHICQEKLKRRKLKIVSNFNANEVDLWVPGLNLGIEVREVLSSNCTNELVNLLKNTNSSKKTKYLAVVCPDELTDLIFHSWRDIERSNVVPNLSVLRVGDFGSYLDKISEYMKEDKEST